MDSQHNMRIALELARTATGQTSPNHSANGIGIGLLRAAGIEVVTSTLQAEQLKQAFFQFNKDGTPYVTLKAAATLDGRLSTQIGDSKWIS